MRKLLLALALVASLVLAAPAGAITFGQFDGNRHPNVGALWPTSSWPPPRDRLSRSLPRR